MSVETLALPRLGETMQTGRIAGWLKRPGEAFKRGETIVEIESDKTVVEMPALADGRLVDILAAEGSDIEVGAPLCTFEASASAAAVQEQAIETASPSGEDPPTGKAPVDDAPIASGARQRATPVARRLARDNGLSLDEIEGTGRRGRVEARDVRTAANGGAHGSEADVLRDWTPDGSARGTVVLLHGFGGDAQTWAALAAGLSRKGFRTIAPDLPAHGTNRREAADLACLVDAAIEFVETIEGEFELVGHSMGAVVAIGIARALPDRVRRLTLMAPAGLGTEIDSDFVTGMAGVHSAGVLAHLLRRLAVRPPALSTAQLTEMVAKLGAGRLAGLASAILSDGRQALDITADLQALTMPTRIVWGLEDRIIPWRHVLQAPSRTALHLVANAGHMPHWDQPQEIAALFD